MRCDDGDEKSKSFFRGDVRGIMVLKYSRGGVIKQGLRWHFKGKDGSERKGVEIISTDSE